MAYREIVLNNARLANGTEGYYDYSGNQLVLCTWAVNSSGKVGNCCVARSNSSNQAPRKAEYNIPYITSEVCPQMLGKIYAGDVYEKLR